MTDLTTQDPTDDIPLSLLIATSQDAILSAKQQELLEWKQRNVYSEVKFDDQDLITLRWVCKPKLIDDKPSVKARRCARGFQEDLDIRSDSPSCSREGIRIALTIIASMKWQLNGLDVRTAFLQGRPIDRDVYVLPPKEANTNHVWKLNKTIYGLNDASRSWYLKLRDELVSLKATPILLDQGIFAWYDGSDLIGLIVCFVDDLLWGGAKKFTNTINSLRERFDIGSENTSHLAYIGINLIQRTDHSILINQNACPITAMGGRIYNARRLTNK